MARTDAEERLRASKTRRIEAIALGMLATLPIVPYLAFLLRFGVPRFSLFGELALLEQATRHVWRGDAWLGPWDEAGWHHPGPVFFYVAAPFQTLFGAASTGLYVATCFVNAVSAATLVGSTRLFGRRAHAASALLGVLAWFVAFGDAAANPSNAAVVVLPLMAFVVTAALFARNRSSSLAPAYPAVFLGALVAETRVAALPTVLVIGVVATAVFVSSARRRGGLSRAEAQGLGIAGLAFAILLAPVFIEQMTAPVSASGNIARLWQAFASRRGSADSSLSIATQNWTTTSALLPLRIVQRALADDGALPAMLAPIELPHGVTPMARAIAFAHVVFATLAAFIAVRRADLISLSLVAFGLLGDVVAVSTLCATSGITTREAAFWMTAAGTVTRIGILSTFAMAVGSMALRVPSFARFIAPTVIVVGLTAAVTATSLQRVWLGKHSMAPSSRPDLASDLLIVESALRERAQQDGSLVIVHRDFAAPVADAVVLELEKDGVAVFSAAASSVYAGQPPGPPSSPDALHVYAAMAAESPPLRCLEPLARSGDLSLYLAASPAAPCATR
jgi:hypothetical protein